MKGESYVEVLGGLEVKVKASETWLAKKKVLFRQGNAPPQTSMKVMAKMNELCYKLVLHSLYPKYISSSMTIIYSKARRNESVVKKNHSSNEEVKIETGCYFLEFIEKFEHLWAKWMWKKTIVEKFSQKTACPRIMDKILRTELLSFPVVVINVI